MIPPGSNDLMRSNASLSTPDRSTNSCASRWSGVSRAIVLFTQREAGQIEIEGGRYEFSFGHPIPPNQRLVREWP